MNQFIQRLKDIGRHLTGKRTGGERKQRIIAVISLDTLDFISWKRENKLIGNNPITSRQFVMNNNKYYCISKALDLHSLTIDETIETKNANKNKEYKEIKEVALLNTNAKNK